jgi:hypothetical protein
MSSINQITAVIVESLLNSPYKGYYKKDYLSVLKTLNSIYQEKQKFEDWMVDDFVNQIVGGTKDLLKRYPKLGKSKECARNMLEHYIYWSYEIGNVEEAENIKKSYEETTGLKYNKNKLQDIIYVNNTTTVVSPTTSKSVTFTFTPPKHLDKNKIFRFNIEGSIEPVVEDKEMKMAAPGIKRETNNNFINMIKIILFFLFLKFTVPSPIFNAIVENGKSVVSSALGPDGIASKMLQLGTPHFESLGFGNR